MAAGRMVKVYTAKKSKLTVKKVKQIAKSAAQSASETKSRISGEIKLRPPDTLTEALNLFYNVNQGINSQDRQGKQIFVKNVRIKGAIVNNFNVSANTKTTRIMVIKTDQELTSSLGGTGISPTTIFRTSPNAVPERHLDLRRVNVLYDKIYKSDYTSGGAPSKLIPFEINLKMNKKLTFISDSNSYLKDGQYYVVVSNWDASGGGTFHSACEFTYAVNFKDA